MQYLSPSEIKKIAPAITRLPSRDENLVDTTAFLRHIYEDGYRPIIAIQGTPHADAKSQSRGRHLAVAANRSGEVIAILNSHTVWRKAWLGAGFVMSGSFSETPIFIIGACVPLPRWRGFEEPLTTLQGYQTSIQEARDALGTWHTTIHQRRWMARHFASTAYLPGYKTPAPRELLIETNVGATPVLSVMLDRVFQGGLEPDVEPTAYWKPRKLKPIQSPDAVFHAANAAFQTGIAAMAKYKVGTYAFPQFNGRDSRRSA
jgi:hypothetical protein